MIPRKMLKMRLMLGYSQGKLGELLGVHRDTIRNYETGKTPVPIDIYNELRGMYRDFKKAEKFHEIKKTACDAA